MKLPAFNPQDRDHATWKRAVDAELDAKPAIAMRYLNASAPYTRKPPDAVRSKPIDVIARASKASDSRRTESGLRVVWEWLGAEIKIVSIDVSDTSSEYDVTLEFRMR